MDVEDKFFDYGGEWMDMDSGAEFLTRDEQGWIQMVGDVFLTTDGHG